MKLWDKGYKINEVIERFTIGNDRELDHYLIPYDLIGSKAHAEMLQQIDIIDHEELEKLINKLDELIQLYEAGDFQIEEEFEDIHSKVEHELVKSLGDTGKKIHTARSRNDQILVDLHLYAKAEILHLQDRIIQLFNSLLNLAEQYKDNLMPGYTHMQVAMPSSFGLWFSAYAENLIDDIIQLKAAYQIADQNPLGSAAGFGSSFPIDRNTTTKKLGFTTMKYNVVAAQMSRGRMEKSLAFGLASLSATLSKLASDVCLYCGQNYNFISFPKEFTTGSSIMPHKQNPDVFELIRAKCNKIQNLPNEIQLICGNLSSGYHRDFQLLKESLIGSIESMKQILEVCTLSISAVKVNQEILNSPIYDHLFSVEAVNEKVLEGLSFRDAYLEVGKDILEGNYQVNKQFPKHQHLGSMGNLALEQIRKKLNQHLISA